ncbi:MAG: hypothetical protein FWG10_03685 [Eubacteriaceae bacterium]|nr:hypothetical protein [Eubacteriaceae bacterium]
MIKIDYKKKPCELTPEIAKCKTERYKSNRDEKVWCEEYIQTRLREMSHGKCCYCERELKYKNDYEEYDIVCHYSHPSKHPEKVLEWKNLLPVCPICKDERGEFDTDEKPIINPRCEYPSDHLYLNNYRYYGKSTRGKNTVEAFKLNDRKNATRERFDISDAVIKSLSELYEKSKSEDSSIIRGFRDLLRLAQPQSPFSALIATSLLNEPNYHELKQYMERMKYWNCELKDMDKTIRKNSLTPPENKRNETMGQIIGNEFDDISIGIVTALSHEFAAVEVLLDNFEELPFTGEDAIAGNRHYIGEIQSNQGGMHKVVLCMLPKYGTDMAAIITSKMMARFPSIRNIIMCGIAGGIPSEVRLGDLVVSTKGVMQYDLGTDNSITFIQKGNPRDCSDFLLEAVRLLEAEEEINGCKWMEHINTINNKNEKDYSRPTIKKEILDIEIDGEYITVEQDVALSTSYHTGKIASGNSVLRNPKRRDSLHQEHGVIAVEMESSGVSAATHLGNHGYIAVRGICDYCDTQKNDDWQRYAAAVAAAYTYELIKSIPTFQSSEAKDKSKIENYKYSNISSESNILLETMRNRYSLSELTVLAFRIDIEMEDIGGATKDEKIVELIKHCERKQLLDNLVSQINIDTNNALQTNE